jgi:uncharacterized membrane protein YecN with MAPEG domain
MIPVVTPYYAAALTALFIVLSFRVIGQRRAKNVSLGDAGDKLLLGRIRAHGNCAEYVPLGLFLLLLAELGAAPVWGLHLAGGLLLLGRVLHAVALSGGAGLSLRAAGMVMTFGALALSAVLALV